MIAFVFFVIFLRQQRVNVERDWIDVDIDGLAPNRAVASAGTIYENAGVITSSIVQRQ